MWPRQRCLAESNGEGQPVLERSKDRDTDGGRRRCLPLTNHFANQLLRIISRFRPYSKSERDISASRYRIIFGVAAGSPCALPKRAVCVSKTARESVS
jgi:hypothetical protein